MDVLLSSNYAEEVLTATAGPYLLGTLTSGRQLLADGRGYPPRLNGCVHDDDELSTPLRSRTSGYLGQERRLSYCYLQQL